MKSKGLERLLRLLLVLLGIGIGLALFQVGIEWYNLAYKDAGIPAWIPGAGYTGMGILGGLVFLLLSAPFSGNTFFLLASLISCGMSSRSWETAWSR